MCEITRTAHVGAPTSAVPLWRPFSDARVRFDAIPVQRRNDIRTLSVSVEIYNQNKNLEVIEIFTASDKRTAYNLGGFMGSQESCQNMPNVALFRCVILCCKLRVQHYTNDARLQVEHSNMLSRG